MKTVSNKIKNRIIVMSAIAAITLLPASAIARTVSPPVPVPEPSILGLLSIGVIVLLAARRRK